MVPQWLSFYQGPTNGPLGLLPAGTFFGRLGRSSHLDSHTPTRFHNERKATEKKMFLPHGLYNGLWWFSFLVHAKLLASADSCSLWGRGTLIKMGLGPLWYEPQWKNWSKFDSLILPWLSQDFTLQGKYWMIHKYTKSNWQIQIQNVIPSSHLDSHTRFHMAEQERPGRLTWTGSTVRLHIKVMGWWWIDEGWWWWWWIQFTAIQQLVDND